MRSKHKALELHNHLPMSLSAGSFAKAVLDRLARTFDTRHAVDFIKESTQGDFWIYGGSLRRVLFSHEGLSNERGGDLDLVVPDHDARIYASLKDLGLEFSLNHSGHHRYLWNKLQIDVCEPREWFRGASSIEELLRSCDLAINSLALHVGSATIIDPHRVLDRPWIEDPGINWSFWETASYQELALLVIRFVRIMFDIPILTIGKEDSARLSESVLPRLQAVDWSGLGIRFPTGRDKFVEEFRETIKGKTRR